MCNSEKIIQNKSYEFSIRIVKLYQYLCEEKNEFTLSKQVLRSGTSIAANIEEAIGGFSKKDFIAKCSISYKEARETHYWIRLLKDTFYIDSKIADSLLNDCDEILKILFSIIRTSRNNEN